MTTIKEQVLKEFPDAVLNRYHSESVFIYSYEGSAYGNLYPRLSEEDAWLDFKSKYCKPIPLLPIITKELSEEDIENGINNYCEHLCDVMCNAEYIDFNNVREYFLAGVNWYKQQIK
jgi:hypothetical protein